MHVGSIFNPILYCIDIARTVLTTWLHCRPAPHFGARLKGFGDCAQRWRGGTCVGGLVQSRLRRCCGRSRRRRWRWRRRGSGWAHGLRRVGSGLATQCKARLQSLICVEIMSYTLAKQQSITWLLQGSGLKPGSRLRVRAQGSVLKRR